MRNVYGMLRYCYTVNVCRRQMLRQYFDQEEMLHHSKKGEGAMATNHPSTSKALTRSLHRWSTTSSDANDDPSSDICHGHCDVCVKLQSVDQYQPKTLSLLAHAYTLCTLIITMRDAFDERLTLSQCQDTWYGRVGGLKNKGAVGVLKTLFAEMPDGRAHYPLETKLIPGEEAERILVHLILEQVLEEEFHFTAYSTITYLKVGQKGRQLVSCVERGLPLPPWWNGMYLYLENKETKSASKTAGASKKRKTQDGAGAGDVDGDAAAVTPLEKKPAKRATAKRTWPEQVKKGGSATATGGAATGAGIGTNTSTEIGNPYDWMYDTDADAEYDWMLPGTMVETPIAVKDAKDLPDRSRSASALPTPASKTSSYFHLDSSKTPIPTSKQQQQQKQQQQPPLPPPPPPMIILSEDEEEEVDLL